MGDVQGFSDALVGMMQTDLLIGSDQSAPMDVVLPALWRQKLAA